MKCNKFSVLAFACMAICAVKAEEINGIKYNAIDFNYGSLSAGSSKFTFENFKTTGVSGSYILNDFLISVGYETAASKSINANGVNLELKSDLKQTGLEVGYRIGLNAGYDFVPSIGHVSSSGSAKLNSNVYGNLAFDEKASANFFALTIYNRLTDDLQSNIGITRFSENSSTASIGLLYKLSKLWGVRGNFAYTAYPNGGSYTQKHTTIGVSYFY